MKRKIISTLLSIAIIVAVCAEATHASRAECIARANSAFIECLQEAGLVGGATAISSCVSGALLGSFAGGIGAIPGCILAGVPIGGFTGLALAYLCGTRYAEALSDCQNE